MEIRQYTNCSETQNQEKYLCLNKACYTAKKKQLHCHECLVKLHKASKNNINHYEEFVTLDQVMNDIQRRNIKKFEIYNQIIFEAYQYKKAKFQELCSLRQFSSKSSEFQNQIFKRIEQIIEEIQKVLAPQIEQIRLGQQFTKDKLQQLIECYLQNDSIFEESFKQTFQDIRNKVETYISSIQLSDIQNQKKKSQFIEKRIDDQCGSKAQLKQELSFRQYLLLAFLILIPVSYVVFQIQQLDAKISNMEQYFQQAHDKSIDVLKQQGLESEKNINQLSSEINKLTNLLNSIEKIVVGQQETIINNDSKQILKFVQLQKKFEEEIQKVKQYLLPLLENQEKTIPSNIKKQFNFKEKSELIDEEYITKRLIEENQLDFSQISLLYKSKRDGLSLKDFWNKMTKTGSTLLIAKFHNGQIIGALTIPPFIPSFYGDYVVDTLKKSFLFSYTQDQIFPLKVQNFTLYTKFMVGPQYGQGPDLSLQGEKFDQCSSYLGFTYEKHNITDPQKFLLQGSPKIIEMEVFLLQ